MKSLFFILFPLTLTVSLRAFAWGGRGHHLLCDVATHLVQAKELRIFLTTRPHVMGHLCNVPDTVWRSLPKDMTSEGNPSHFIDWELIGGNLKSFPLDYSKLITDFEGKKKPGEDGIIGSIPHELGSLWWRADQFYRQALSYKEELNQTSFSKEDDEFSKAVYGFYTNLGLMGHFVGDNSQPFHITLDYDGYGRGHGGIHAYYEDQVLSAMDGDLHYKVLIAARKLVADSHSKRPKKGRFLTGKTPLEKMRSLAVESNNDIDLIYSIDRLKKPSTLLVMEGGLKQRVPAEREPLEKTKGKFEPLLVKHLARGAALTAVLWDEAYIAVGSPPLSTYKSFKYPFLPEFIYPDYGVRKVESGKESEKSKGEQGL